VYTLFASLLNIRGVQCYRTSAIANVVVLVEKKEIHAYPRLRPRQTIGDCSSQCSLVNQALSTCDDDSCFCPALSEGYTQCSQCYATLDATAASLISSAMSICDTEFVPSTTLSTITASPTFNPLNGCNSQCSLVQEAASVCLGDACFCATALIDGPACSSCLLGVNVTEAQIVGSALSICMTEFEDTATVPVITAAATLSPNSVVPIYTENGPAPASSSSSSSSSSTSSSGLSGGAIGGIVGGIIGSFSIAVAGTLFFMRRGKRVQLAEDAYGSPSPSITAAKYM
jgi:hypothetical protein